ncbi:tyrosine-type recombinase/integrase [Bradyrhizobium sp. 6(2017)]|uniref:tyrosine-type recombinase/integrase n=1 Tax=Bradyrhizobium sp. 6(2017) TaxID=1197460 RepID=UPI0013E1DDD1|nr:site-specific integrase [Bradyrhizobium sp. 6(2017)]QIG96818.1 site-specific integrase [Bradyrhizobium sp. 6(2017)]
MSHHASSASQASSASTLLPSAEVVSPLTAKQTHATRRTTFTKANVRKMCCPPGLAEKLFWDAGCRGLGIRALSSKRRSWVFQYRDEHGRTRRIALGDVSVVGLDEAREEARHKAASITRGANPSVERKAKRNAGTVLDLIEAYLSQAKTRLRPRSFTETERNLRRHAACLHHDRVEAVRRRDISEVLERISKKSGPIAANHVRAALSALWSWGLRTGRVDGDANPVTFTIQNPKRTRDRALNEAEIRAIWSTTSAGDDYGRIVRLCLLTGCRREEIAGLRWSEVLTDTLVIGADRMKGKLAHEIPLVTMIAGILPPRPENATGCVFGKRGTGFSGFSQGKKKLDASLSNSNLNMPPWVLHDLRRTFSTWLHDAGIDPIVIEALLAHKQQGVAAVYNRASFREAKRTALQRWHEIVAGILQPPIE